MNDSRGDLRHRFARISIIVAISAAIAIPVRARSQETLQNRIDAQVHPYITHEIVRGLVVGVVYQGEAHVFGYGTGSDSGAPTGNTVYEIGSISKVFTGILLADAVVRGRARLDQPVQELLPDGVTMPHKGDPPIRLVNLSTHTSGLPRMPDNFRPADANNPYADYTPELMYAFLNRYTPSRGAGEVMAYSNFGAGLLGQVLAVQAGGSYEQLLRDRIAGPLGMDDTVIRLNAELQGRLAPGHFKDGTTTSNWDFDALAGAGGIRSTAADMLRFMEAQLQPPDGELGDAIELAWAVQQQPINSGDFAMGLGWHIARDASTRWHNGETGGYHSQMLISRLLGAGVVVLSNTATAEVDVLAETLIRMLAGANVPPREFSRTETVAVSPEVMARYPGTYELAPGVVFTVSVDGDKLMVGLTGQSAYRVFPRSDTEWYYKVVEATITFKVDDNGCCTELELFQNGVRQPARRVN